VSRERHTANRTWERATPKRKHTSRGALRRKRNDARPRRSPTGSGVHFERDKWPLRPAGKNGALCNRGRPVLA
jgi:hypothetical protein